MKKIILIVALSAGLISCQNQNLTLDTSNLEKIPPKGIGNISKDQLKTLPIDYKAPSTKIALKSLPFEVKLPSKLPFESTPFKLQQLQDVRHDGKTIRVEFTAFNKEKNNIKMVSILVTNQKNVTFAGTKKEVKLKNKVKGYIQGKLIYFKNDNITYEIGYTAEDGSNLSDKQLIDLANQMIK
ncbi:hypothetical protein J5Y03_11765 [Bacillus sp. RG28]|uniref:DUF4367 domain-containing protein n=1 Tax=Gottfriedia endophytica TaxID=2820819 RepID=A0A940NKF9_9BACI|nr:hypothetical protein [Gottfriedia endophytica]MBP0725847.1 hypothetical protein [Gottfriedia endophytica]